jgi:hypothetical protein
MIIDSQLEFSHAQSAIGAAAAAINSTKAVDIGPVGNIGDGAVPWLVVRVRAQILAAGGAANVTFKLLEDSQADMASGSAKTLWTSGAIPKANLVDGYVVGCIQLPRTTKQHLRVTITPDTNDTTAGTVDAFVTPNPDAWQAFPTGSAIL